MEDTKLLCLPCRSSSGWHQGLTRARGAKDTASGGAAGSKTIFQGEVVEQLLGGNWEAHWAVFIHRHICSSSHQPGSSWWDSAR